MMKILFMLIVVLMLGGQAFAATTVHTSIECNGNCSITQTVNNKTIELESNEGMSIVTSVVNDTVNVSVNATGLGQVKTSGQGEYEARALVDGKEETKKGTGIFQLVFEFFRSITFFGWFK